MILCHLLLPQLYLRVILWLSHVLPSGKQHNIMENHIFFMGKSSINDHCQ